jgi:3-oxoacyl-[acyl-carrier protein] reductase/meso-butanediol dehydrogenase/(S,S)-butanediol dehydrogenase/diacetyl reductase
MSSSEEKPVKSDRGRVVIVTGGGRGIGAAITRAFHSAGDRVAILSRTDSDLTRALQGRGIHVVCDVRHPDELARAVRDAVTWGGRLDVLVNNAGMSAWRPLEAIDEPFWTDMIDTNLSSALFACKAAVPHLAADGAIVNVSSLAGKRGSAKNAAYCAAKFGMNGLTQALAKELGPRGIRVNAVCPVYVETKGLHVALSDADAPPRGQDVALYLGEFARTQAALGRLPTGDEVAAACVMLASSVAGAITGQCINVDCGVLPQ